jgi:transcriptional regulator with XRE-family HTH domain
MTFAEKLRELRHTAGLSEAKLANTSGVAFAALHTYSLGRSKPPFAAVVKIAKALGVTCEAFAGCDDVQADGDEPAARPAPAGRGRKAPAKGRAKRT